MLVYSFLRTWLQSPLDVAILLSSDTFILAFSVVVKEAALYRVFLTCIDLGATVPVGYGRLRINDTVPR